MKKDIITITFVTLYLFAYVVIGQLGAGLQVMLIMFALSPFLLIWMVLSVLKSSSSSNKGLKENEEWGYGK